MGEMTLAWKEHDALISDAKFSLICAHLLHDELDNVTDNASKREWKRRHRRHIRAGLKNLRKAKRLRAKIRRYEGTPS